MYECTCYVLPLKLQQCCIPQNGGPLTLIRLQAVLALGAGWCVYTWLSWGGCKPHTAHHQSRVERGSHSTVCHVMSLKVWKRILADRGGVWNDEDTKLLRVKASVKCGRHLTHLWWWHPTFSIHLKSDSRSPCAFWLELNFFHSSEVWF